MTLKKGKIMSNKSIGVSIKVSPNGRYFVDQNDEPFFWLGDTQWELFRLFSIEDAEYVLENRKSKGFSVIQIMFTGVGDGSGANLEGQTPWINNDPDIPNEAYFKNVDEVIKLGQKHELILVLGIYHQLQVSRITMRNGKKYAKWIAERYKDFPNIVWTMYPKAEKEFIPILRVLAEGLQEGDSGKHLITVHPDPAVTSSSFIHNESWLSFNMIQTCIDYERIYEMVSKDYVRIPAKPVVMAEGGYEGLEFNKLQTSLEIRKQAYWSHLAGGHHSYGHNDSWLFPAKWRSWIDSPGSFHLKVYRDIITSCPEWWNWIPDQSIIASGENSGINLNVSARSASGDWLLVYLCSENPVSIRMDKITASDTIKASWIDTTSGEKMFIDSFKNTGIKSFTKPSKLQDALLILESL